MFDIIFFTLWYNLFMFTGIVKEVGRIERITKIDSLIKLGISAKDISRKSGISDSISINGVCLTLVDKKGDVIFFEAIASTLKNTNLKRLKKGTFVNLEPALTLGEKLGGHFVLGHVDAELKLRRIIKKSSYWELEVELLSEFRKFILDNGSVAIEGISLTVKKVLSKVFTTNVIPFTYNNTNIRYKKAGDWINLEFDYLLKQNKAQK